MRHPWISTISFSLPIIVAVLGMTVVFFEGPLELTAFGINIGPLELSPVIGNEPLLKTVIASTIVLVCVLWMWNRDYSKFFPRQIDFSIHFDYPGLQLAVKGFSARELNMVEIAEEWENHVPRSIDVMNEMLKQNNVRISNRPQVKYAEVDRATGSGRGICRISLAKKEGFQQYLFDDGWGVVKFEFSEGNATTAVWLPFDLRRAPFDNVSLGFRALATGKFVVRPTFSQYGQISAIPEAKILDLVVVAKLQIWPGPSLKECLFCVLADEIGVSRQEGHRSQIIPVGYAGYSSI